MTQEIDECEVADEPVVVMKSRPVKASNSEEGKTEMMASGDLVGSIASKVQLRCEGEK